MYHRQHNIKEFPKENNIGRQLNICANPKIVKTKVHKRKKKSYLDKRNLLSSYKGIKRGIVIPNPSKY